MSEQSEQKPAARTELERFGDVTRVRLETPDLSGALRGKYLSADKVRSGSALPFPEVYLAATVDDDIFEASISAEDTGFGDMLLAPDWSTARAMPGEPGVVAVLGDGLTKDGERHPMHPRSVLRHVVDRAASHGYEGVFGVEYEFSIFRSDEVSDEARRTGNLSAMTRISRSNQGYSLSRWADFGDFAADLDASARAYGVAIEMVMTEVGNHHLEAALAPAPALQAADMAARFKILLRDVARRHGFIVSFMAKVNMAEQGTSGHLHQSLWQDGKNVFWGGRPGTLSEAGRQYAAGALRAAHECTAFFAPYPNSYRRYTPGYFAPVTLDWGWDNRIGALRAITLSESSARFENRRGGSDFQPYLAIAASLAGGVDGILTSAELNEPGTPVPGRELPQDLGTAAALLRESEFARDWLGADLVELFAQSREHEVRAYADLAAANIPAWEILRYFENV
ncbi:glutamine synthetase family protein [Streptomyces sp. NBC_01485]|uniref:glutamine synthetase family protein n=1 Tax=Streptomyces sp. NBC_01485 TaxID=2903884 RepID=UPI002E302975|nr:glutamine synthetase family protein [Streptomyces sp. NBC_01485]